MHEIDIHELTLNPVTAVGEDWMLVTAGTKERGYNTMTAAWGHLGSVWGESSPCGPSAVIYVRQSRYTREFLDRESLFTLSFYGGGFRRELGYLGSRSGRDGDKVAAVGFTPVFGEDCVTFEQAELTLVCRKLYHAPLLPEHMDDPTLRTRLYADGDLHVMYIGRILTVLKKD